MIALIGNISLLETVVILVVALLIFGDRLPQVAARVYAEIRRLRRTLDDLRRSSGIDREIREIRRSVEDAAQRARIDDPLVDIHTPPYAVKPRGAEGSVPRTSPTPAAEPPAQTTGPAEPPAAPGAPRAQVATSEGEEGGGEEGAQGPTHAEVEANEPGPEPRP